MEIEKILAYLSIIGVIFGIIKQGTSILNSYEEWRSKRLERKIKEAKQKRKLQPPTKAKKERNS